MSLKSRFDSIPLSEKIPLYFIFIGLVSILVVGLFSYFSAKKALIDRTFDQLTSVRIEKQKRIEKHLQDCQSGIDYFHSKLKNQLTHSLSEVEFRQKFQELIEYSPFKTNLYEEFFVFTDSSGFSFSLNDTEVFNPKKTESLAYYRTLIDSIKPDSINQNQFIDVSGTIYLSRPFNSAKGRVFFGALLNQEVINDIMLETNLHNGLGLSGEAYLVGSDHQMKSQSRFIKNSVSRISVSTLGVEEALKNQVSTGIFPDYRGIRVLSSYGTINFKNIHWAVLAEIDENEAMIPVFQLKNQIMLSSILISFILLVISFLLSRQLTKPLKRLSRSAMDLAKGKFVDELEVTSQDEMGELTASFNFMVKELKQKTEALSLEKKNQMKSMFDGQEQERQRISRDLHDGLGQQLSGIKMKLEKQFAKSDKNEADTKEILQEFNLSIEEVRRMSNNLRPAVLENFGISSALRQLCEDIKKNTDLVVYDSIDDLDVSLSKKQQTYLFRMAQEALNNVMKHAGAKVIGVNLYIEDAFIFLIIEDDGCGYSEDTVVYGSGLMNMKERTALVNGEIRIQTEVGRGTIISIKTPLSDSETDEKN